MGPAALARNLRTLPVVLEIARDMDRYCPKAVMLNFTNPMSAITGTINRYSGVRTMGLCHSAEDLLVYFAKLYKCAPHDIRMKVGGVNHMSFVTSLVARGKERIGTLIEDAARSDATLEDSLMGKAEKMNIQRDLYSILGVFPSTGDEHAAEFYRFFLTDRRAGELGLHTKKISADRKPLGPSQPNELLVKWAYGPGPVEDMDFLTTEHAHELMWAVIKGKPTTRVVNILNDGFIAGLPRTACVEVMVKVTKKGYEGKELVLPTACTALLAQWTAVHELSIQAALHGDREAARQALFLDPHVADMYDIDGILGDFVERLGKWLPKWRG
jgi:alpha-galactosidase